MGEVVDGRLDAAFADRAKRVEQLTTFVAMAMLGAAFWLAWPDLQSSFSGDRTLASALGAPILVLTWALLMQDLVMMTPRSRSRLGAATTIGWLPMLILGSWTLEGNTGEMTGGLILMALGGVLFKSSRFFLQGKSVTIRYRGVMGGVGVIFSSSLVAASAPDVPILYLNIGILLFGIWLAASDWLGGDDDREIRKEFRVKLNELENQILQLRSDGAPVDQAASLVMSAGEDGHLDPKWGLQMLYEAEDDIERTLRFSEDVEEIRAEVQRAIDEAEAIAPLVRRPASAMTQGDREMELGSLREAELLYRQAKNRADEIIEWWGKAEEAITCAARSLTGLEGPEADSLRGVLKESKQRLDAEQPEKAFEFASSIPLHIENIGKAHEFAEDALAAAKAAIKATDGLDTSEWMERLTQAEDALEKGDHSLARGLSDGISREVVREREAMSVVRRALRQKRKLAERFAGRSDEKDWLESLNEVKKTADNLQWSHAATLLERLTTSLDRAGAESDEAGELLSFVQDEWKILRNQLDAANIKISDQMRRDAEAAIAKAKDAHNESRIEETLALLGETDGLMERLRRRI
jgi:hypothetical protein